MIKREPFTLFHEILYRFIILYYTTPKSKDTKMLELKNRKKRKLIIIINN